MSKAGGVSPRPLDDIPAAPRRDAHAQQRRAVAALVAERDRLDAVDRHAVDDVERALRERGFRQVRARHHGDEVRLEVEPEHVPRLTELLEGHELAAIVRAAGFARVEVARDGYRRGRLNPPGVSDTTGAAP